MKNEELNESEKVREELTALRDKHQVFFADRAIFVIEPETVLTIERLARRIWEHDPNVSYEDITSTALEEGLVWIDEELGDGSSWGQIETRTGKGLTR